MVRLAPGRWCLTKDHRRFDGALAPRPWSGDLVERRDNGDKFDRSHWVVRDLFETDGEVS